MDICLGLFRTSFPIVSAASIVAQLSTGSTNFNYVTVGGDSTETEGGNIASARNSATNGTWKSVVWVHPTDGRIVTTMYLYGEKTPKSDDEAITTYNRIHALQCVVLVDGVLVAKVPTAYLSTSGFGGVHIKDIGGTEYLVGYYLQNTTGASVIVLRQSVVLNMSADQTNPPSFANSSDFQFTDTVGDDFEYCDQLPNPYGAQTTFEYGRYLAQANRNFVVNADGSKVIFFCKREYSGNWANFPIFELSDDGTTLTSSDMIEINEISNVSKVEASITQLTDIQSGSYATNIVQTVNGCPDPWTTMEETQTISGTMSASESYGLTGGTTGVYFLGVSYDRTTDTPIYLIHNDSSYGSGLAPLPDQTLSASHSGVLTRSKIYPATSWTTDSDTRETNFSWTLNSTNFGGGVGFEVFNAGTDASIYSIDFTENDYFNYSGSGIKNSSGTTIAVTGSFKQHILDNYQIVDLSCGIFLYNVLYRGGTVDYSGISDAITFDTYIANVGIEEADKEMLYKYYFSERDTSTFVYSESSGEASTVLDAHDSDMNKTFTATSSSDTCTGLPAMSCDNPNQSCSITYNY